MWGHCPLQQQLLPSLLVGMHWLETCVFVVAAAAAAGFVIVVAQEVVLAPSFVVVFALVVFVGYVVVAADVVATVVAAVPVFETVVVVVAAADDPSSMQEGLEKSDQSRGLQHLVTVFELELVPAIVPGPGLVSCALQVNSGQH